MAELGCIVFTSTLSDVQLRSLESLVESKNRIRLYSFYKLRDRIHRSVEVLDAQSFLGIDCSQFPIEMIENLFSYKYILTFGGWFVSISRVIIGRLGSKRNHVFCEQSSITDDNWIGDFLLRGEKGSVIFMDLYSQCHDMMINKRIMRTSASGTELLTTYLKKNPLYRGFIVPSESLRIVTTVDNIVPKDTLVTLVLKGDDLSDSSDSVKSWIMGIEDPDENDPVILDRP